MKRLLQSLALPALLIVAAILWINHQLNERVRTHADAPQLIRIHAPAPMLAFTSLDGQPQHFPANRIVVINLWATWCLPCIAEMRTFQPLYNRYRNDDGVAFLFIDFGDTPAQIRAFAARYHLDLPFYLATPDPNPLNTPSLPTTWILAPDGSLAARQSGPANWSDSTVTTFLAILQAPASAP